MSEKANVLVTFEINGVLHSQSLYSSQISLDIDSINPIIKSAVEFYLEFCKIVISETDTITNILVYQYSSNEQKILIAKQLNYRNSQEMVFFNTIE